MASFLALKLLLQALDDRAQDLEPRVFLVVGFDQRPRRAACVGAVDHFVRRRLVLRPFPAVAPVFLSDLVAFRRTRGALTEACELLLLADREPEFYDEDARARHLALEIVDLRVGAHPVVARAEAFDALDEYAPIPASVKD